MWPEILPYVMKSINSKCAIKQYHILIVNWIKVEMLPQKSLFWLTLSKSLEFCNKSTGRDCKNVFTIQRIGINNLVRSLEVCDSNKPYQNKIMVSVNTNPETMHCIFVSLLSGPDEVCVANVKTKYISYKVSG